MVQVQFGTVSYDTVPLCNGIDGPRQVMPPVEVESSISSRRAAAVSGQCNTIQLRPWTPDMPLSVLSRSGAGYRMVPSVDSAPRQEPIDLRLYDVSAHSIRLSGHRLGHVIRFTLHKWDETRLDGLLASVRKSLRGGPRASVSRLLLHDDHWIWRLQVTIYLSTSSSTTDPDAEDEGSSGLLWPHFLQAPTSGLTQRHHLDSRVE